jgi:hypothetical protein
LREESSRNRTFVPKACLIKQIFHFGLTRLEVHRLILRPSMGTEKPKADQRYVWHENQQLYST